MKIVDLVKSKTLTRALRLKQQDIVTVVGAGGKTSLCLKLCEEAKNKAKVIYTTTTKMYPPEYRDGYSLAFKNHFSGFDFYDKGVYIIGKELNSDSKITSLELEELKNLRGKYDLLVIEGDGSREKPLKGWESFEPVVLDTSSKTIGVVDITSIGLCINEENIHRIEKFCNITGREILQNVGIEDLVSLIIHKEGLFKNSVGDKILYINKVESEKTLNDALELIKLIKLCNIDITRYVIGSLNSDKYGYTVGKVNEYQI